MIKCNYYHWQRYLRKVMFSQAPVCSWGAGEGAATKARMVGKRAVRIVWECFVVAMIDFFTISDSVGSGRSKGQPLPSAFVGIK